MVPPLKGAQIQEGASRKHNRISDRETRLRVDAHGNELPRGIGEEPLTIGGPHRIDAAYRNLKSRAGWRKRLQKDSYGGRRLRVGDPLAIRRKRGIDGI